MSSNEEDKEAARTGPHKRSPEAAQSSNPQGSVPSKCPFIGESKSQTLHASTTEDRSSVPKAVTQPTDEPTGGKCPFGFGTAKVPDFALKVRKGKCPYGFGAESASGFNHEVPDLTRGLDTLAVDGHGLVEEQARIEGESAAPKCPMGYDADTVKVGPLTCLICKSLLFNTVRILPCRHVFCNSCCVRLEACGLCGGERHSIEQDDETRMWDQNVHVFIERYARRKKKVPRSGDGHSEAEQNAKSGQDSLEGASADVEGGGHQDLALDQGGLLLQLAMRAYAGRNNESAIHLLKLCEEDLRSALAEEGMSSKVLCQLGAIAGARGDVSRSSQDLPSAAAAYRESATWFEIVEEKDAEVVHDLSVAYNKLGDLHYLAKRPDEAREEYLQALELRQNAHKADSTASQVLDLVVSFTKVADLDRASNKERAAAAHFREAAKLAAELGQKRETYSGALEQKRLSLLDFIVAQMKELGEEV